MHFEVAGFGRGGGGKCPRPITETNDDIKLKLNLVGK